MDSRIVERPWVVVASGLVEFPPSKRQMKYLIVFQDLFTKWVRVEAIRKADGKSVARELLNCKRGERACARSGARKLTKANVRELYL